MRARAPRQFWWNFSFLVGLFGFLIEIGVINILVAYSFWIMFIAWLFLVLPTIFKGM